MVCSLYKSQNYLEQFLVDFRQQSIYEQCELILVHNQPEPKELEIIRKFSVGSNATINHIELSAVEPLAASWNRAWHVAAGEFIAIWNVDDRREPDSLRSQVHALEMKPQVVAVYGDYVEVDTAGSRVGVKRITPQFRKPNFLRSFPQGGAFTVYRKDLAQKIGGFDEQLLVGPDMEYSFRIAASELAMARVPELLGYFTNEKKGLSTAGGGIGAALDRTAIQLRYAVYDKVDLAYLSKVDSFQRDQILSGGKWISLTAIWSEAQDYRASRKSLWIIGRLRNGFRKMLARLGLLNLVHTIQRRFTNRDL